MTLETLSVPVVGDSKVGKTALITRICNGYFVDDFDFRHPSFRRFTESHGKTYIVDFLPFDMRDEYRALVQSYLRSGDGFIIIYSVTDWASFESVKSYHAQIIDLAAPVSPVYLVANKCDTKEGRVVSEDEGRTLAKELRCEYREASVKDDMEGVNEIYHSLTMSMVFTKQCRVFFPDTQPSIWKRVLGLDRTISLTAAKRWLEGPWS